MTLFITEWTSIAGARRTSGFGISFFEVVNFHVQSFERCNKIGTIGAIADFYVEELSSPDGCSLENLCQII